MIDNYVEQDKLKGLRVLEELPLSMAPGFFIELLTPPEKFPSHVPAKWLKPNGNNIEIRLLSAKHIYPDGKRIFLYCFPEAVEGSLRMEDLESPIETIGFLVIVDIRTLQQLDRKVDQEHSAIHLARTYELPIIMAVINARMIKRNTEKLSQLIDYSPDMPIAWCDGDIDLDFVKRTMEEIYSYI